MDSYVIRKLTKERKKKLVAKALCRELRDADRRELKAVARARTSVAQEVYDSIFRAEECYAAYDRTGLIAVWGHASVAGTPGQMIWCLGSHRIAAHRYAFAVESKRILTRWANNYDVLYNAVGAFNRAALAWLKFCGAIFHREVVIGGEYFIPFTIEGEGRR